jgi:hypothetical protein
MVTIVIEERKSKAREMEAWKTAFSSRIDYEACNSSG